MARLFRSIGISELRKRFGLVGGWGVGLDRLGWVGLLLVVGWGFFGGGGGSTRLL